MEIHALPHDSACLKKLLSLEFGEVAFRTNDFNKGGDSFLLTFNHSKSPFPLTTCIDHKGHLENIQSNEDWAVEKVQRGVWKGMFRHKEEGETQPFGDTNSEPPVF